MESTPKATDIPPLPARDPTPSSLKIKSSGTVTTISSSDLAQEINTTLHRHYGYTIPLPDKTIPPLSPGGTYTLLTRLVGSQSPLPEGPEVESNRDLLVAKWFFDTYSAQKAPPSGFCDLVDNVPCPIRMSPRFKYLRRLQLPPHTQDIVDQGTADGCAVYYYFDFPTSRTKAKLVICNPAVALMICRLPETWIEEEIVQFLSQNGIMYRLFFPKESISSNPSRSPGIYRGYRLPVRSLGHVFTKEDYDDYVEARTLLLAQPHMQAAIRRGGIVWRLALSTMLGTAFELPKLTGRYLTAKLGDGNAEDSEYVEDGLTLVELDLICGAYECTDEHGRLAIRSWWPLVRYWEKDECGENYGRWCNRREAWYVSRLEEIKEGFVDKGNSSKRGKPFSYTEWKSCLRGQRPTRLFHQAVRQASTEYIEVHL